MAEASGTSIHGLGFAGEVEADPKPDSARDQRRSDRLIRHPEIRSSL
jgi:hypothetical protein